MFYIFYIAILLVCYGFYRFTTIVLSQPQSDCKGTTKSGGVERFCYFPSLSVAIWRYLSLSVTFLL